MRLLIQNKLSGYSQAKKLSVTDGGKYVTVSFLVK